MSVLPLSPCPISIKLFWSNLKTRYHCRHLNKWRRGNRWLWHHQMYRKRKGTCLESFSLMERRVRRNSFHNVNSSFSQKTSPSSLPVPFQYSSLFKNCGTSLVFLRAGRQGLGIPWPKIKHMTLKNLVFLLSRLCVHCISYTLCVPLGVEEEISYNR